MPSVLIEVRKLYTKEQEIKLMDVVHAALIQAFKILPDDKNVRLIVHESHRFACPGIRGGQAGCDVDLGFKIEV